MRKTLVLGIDALDYRLLRRLLKQGCLPSFSALMKRGAWGRLKTLDPTLSGPIWTTIATGTLPKNHGIRNQVCYFEDGQIVEIPNDKACPQTQQDENLWPRSVSAGDAQGQRNRPHGGRLQNDSLLYPVSRELRKRKAIWNILSLARKKSCVINWWATWPAEPISGIMITNVFSYGALFKKNKGYVYPGRILTTLNEILAERDILRLTDREILSIFPELRGRKEQLNRFKNAFEEDGVALSTLKLSYLHDKYNLAILEHYLQKRRDIDLFMLCLSSLDTFSHLLWGNYIFNDGDDDAPFPFKSAIHNYYKHLDGRLGQLMRLLPKDHNLIVLSDHGIRKSKGWPPGEHVKGPDGTVIVAGEGVRRGARIKGMAAQDITPLILNFCRMPQAEDMDGALVASFRESPGDFGFVRSYEDGKPQDEQKRPSLPGKQRKAIIKRLKTLGYL